MAPVERWIWLTVLREAGYTVKHDGATTTYVKSDMPYSGKSILDKRLVFQLRCQCPPRGVDPDESSEHSEEEDGEDDEDEEEDDEKLAKRHSTGLKIARGFENRRWRIQSRIHHATTEARLTFVHRWTTMTPTHQTTKCQMQDSVTVQRPYLLISSAVKMNRQVCMKPLGRSTKARPRITSATKAAAMTRTAGARS
jgi:hypothetical protein